LIQTVRGMGYVFGDYRLTPIRGPSLTLRLTLLFALASAFVLFLLGLLIGNAVERHFEEQEFGCADRQNAVGKAYLGTKTR